MTQEEWLQDIEDFFDGIVLKLSHLSHMSPDVIFTAIIGGASIV